MHFAYFELIMPGRQLNRNYELLEIYIENAEIYTSKLHAFTIKRLIMYTFKTPTFWFAKSFTYVTPL